MLFLPTSLPGGPRNGTALIRIASMVTALLALATGPGSLAAPPATYTPESRSSVEVFTSPVLKVYALQEGDVAYQAYVVQWKEHEVVIIPSAGPEAKRYAVGDTIRCQMTQFVHRVGDQARPRVSFSMVGDSGDERARLEAVAEEVRRRRALRETGTSTPARP